MTDDQTPGQQLKDFLCTRGACILFSVFGFSLGAMIFCFMKIDELEKTEGDQSSQAYQDSIAPYMGGAIVSLIIAALLLCATKSAIAELFKLTWCFIRSCYSSEATVGVRGEDIPLVPAGANSHALLPQPAGGGSSSGSATTTTRDSATVVEISAANSINSALTST